MALQISSPFIHVEDANGNPYVGAKLYVYQPNSTTLADVFNDDALSDPADNPATSDAAGNFPRLYLDAGTYKLRAETSTAVLIWECDKIDTGLSAGGNTLPISGGGTGATTAAGARTNLDVPSNAQLTALESTVSTIQLAVQNIVSVPQGYLTPTTGVPVITSDRAGVASLYYTPLIGALCPVYDGVQFTPIQFNELPLALNAAHTAGNIYDAFFTLDTNGDPLMVTGPAWTTATAGSGARGTGAGTTQLLRTNGLLVNNFSMTGRNGATTYSIDAFKATFVGSIVIDGVNGQITCHVSYGQTRLWAISNAYNRKRIILKAGDPTASWNYNTNTVRQSNAAAGNTLRLFSCLPEERPSITFTQAVGESTGASDQPSIAIGYNSTTVVSGTRAGAYPVGTGSGKQSQTAFYDPLPFMGIDNVNALENGAATGGTFFGTEADMLLRAEWWG